MMDVMHLVKKDGRGFYRNFKEVEYVKGSKMLNIGDKMYQPGIVPPEDYKFKLWDPVVVLLSNFPSDHNPFSSYERETEVWVRGSVYSTEKNGRINIKCMNIDAQNFFLLSVPTSEVLLASKDYVQ